MTIYLAYRRVGEKEFFLEVVQRLVIQGKLTLERPVGHPLFAPQ